MISDSDIPRAWQALVADLDGDVRAVRRFVRTFLDELDPRVERLAAALTAADADEARDAALSLYTTATMVGASELAAAAATMAELALADPRLALPALPRLRVAARAARTACSAELAAWADGD